MKRPVILPVLAAAVLLAACAVPARAQAPHVEGLFVEPINPTPLDPVELVVVGRQSPECPFVWTPPVYEPAQLLYRIETADPPCDAVASERFEERFLLGTLPLGTRYAEVRHSGGTLGREAISVFGPADRALLAGDRFHVLVDWRNPRDGSAGKGWATELTDESAVFWFFDHKNVEVTVKVLDGRALNGHWWVFLASMTDLAVTITVLDNKDDCLLLPVFPPACPTRTYEQTAGSNRNFLDTRAFAEGGAAAILLSASAAAAQNEIFTVEPRNPSTLEQVRVTAGVYSSLDPDLRFERVHGNRIEFSAEHFDVQLPHQELHTATVELDPLPAGIYQAVLLYRGLPLAITHTFEVRAPDPVLVLHEKRSDVRSFGVTVDWKLPSGQTGQGIAVPLTNESGYFWFFDAGNAEVTIKILDGRPVNGHWWVFLASMTDVEHTVQVTLCPPEGVGAPCLQKEYRNPRGTNRNILDTQAF